MKKLITLATIIAASLSFNAAAGGDYEDAAKQFSPKATHSQSSKAESKYEAVTIADSLRIQSGADQNCARNSSGYIMCTYR